MDDQIARLLQRIAYRYLTAGRRKNRPGIAELAAGLAVKRGLVDDDRDLIAGLSGLGPVAVLEDREDDALGGLGVVAEKLGRPQLLAQREPRGAGRRLARADPT